MRLGSERRDVGFGSSASKILANKASSCQSNTEKQAARTALLNNTAYSIQKSPAVLHVQPGSSTR